MHKKQDQAEAKAALRRAAEARFKGQPATQGPQTKADQQRLLLELSIHQIELEIQNEELRASHDEIEAGLKRYSELFDFAPVGYFDLTADGTIRLANFTGANLVGRECARLKGRCFQTLLAEPDRTAFSDFLQRVFATRTRQVRDITLLKPDQTRLHARLEAHLSPEDGSCRLAMSDITECSRVEAALRESDTRYRTILRTAMDGFWLVDMQGRLLEVNETYCRMSGYSAPELLALHILDLEADETAAATAVHIQKIMALGEDRFESRHRRKDGSVFDVEISVQYQPAEGGYIVAFLRDISERKRREHELKENQARLALAMDQAQLADWEMDAATETFTFNDRFYALYATTAEREGGYQMPALVYAREFLPAEERQLVPEDVARLVAGKIDELQAEHRIRRRDGELRNIAVRINVVRDASGRVVGTRGSNQDITARHRAEQALRDAHWRLASIIAGTRAGTWEWHVPTGAVVCNERWAEIIGYTLAELAPISLLLSGKRKR
jgi:PAS domain S-box-containing protein